MKKWLSILLVCSMLVGSLAGCGSGGKTETKAQAETKGTETTAVKNRNGRSGRKIYRCHCRKNYGNCMV